jgi:hypothetical protein
MITGINLNSLRNAEYLQFIKQVLAITGLNKPADLKVETQFKTLQDYLAALEALFVTEKGSTITENVAMLDTRRDRAINGITTLVNGFAYHYNPDTENHARKLAWQISQYGAGIARENYQAETSIIDNLLVDFNSKPEMAAAVAALQLTDWCNELAAANTAFNDAYLQRTQQLGSVNPQTIFAKRQQTNSSYYSLRDFIDSYFVITQGAVLYNKVTNELNALIDQYNTMMTGRLGNGKGEAAQAPVSA